MGESKPMSTEPDANLAANQPTVSTAAISKAPINEAPNSQICPRCQASNQCAVASGANINACWCLNITFPTRPAANTSDLTLEPNAVIRPDACLCQTCAEAILQIQHLAREIKS
ncbi:cysteine-rich CWC family protein [Shewanella sp. SNU WT4]|uniref:cysteine-rich CWC family protein n=1 Tax=Shewanella sp. SNU WT4 TaxID=2590015 RepID=UPI001F0D7CE2|nr:cysteine-rich CWC family protein [Shewanella sp. SNU WT4]